ncbi:HEAT repeat domain-containing protein [Spirilliplanes yamanashiensis]|uniref:HEAT repeat domain-containing protein n=1 Tax=Spirilliplanes yamanashiensis TaxID=42233 RepID=A0A8J3YB11_9ACTN|nr:HEAT repeat domain-containing protein [Spirilliplanes yamanashiensis]MDP9817802.1 hypothetical protein [Spirilliplanes yamanashiensis]GIJ04612.1 hypothetical protein Sya03_39640 [Spirilliplanes yamanashiensis]
MRSCVALIRHGEADPALVAVLGGPQAPRFLDAPPRHRHWLRVWGARGLLWALPPDPPPAAVAAVVAALDDDSWRVREMAAKVVARHRLDPALRAVERLQHDPVPRVRAAAARALRMLS